MALDTESDSGYRDPGQDREREIARIVADCANRLNEGNEVDFEQIIDDHPALAPDLRDAMSALGDVRLSVSRPQLPNQFGEYKIVRELGRGGMGVVYEALQLPLNRRVALKMLPSELVPNPRALARFQHEARVASSLDHPGICTVYEAGVFDGTPYIAMKYIEGETLARRIKTARAMDETVDSTTKGEILAILDEKGADAVRDPETPHKHVPANKEEIRRLLQLVERAARALHVAHESGFVHRDMSLLVAANSIFRYSLRYRMIGIDI